jgi:hypothetical protein
MTVVLCVQRTRALNPDPRVGRATTELHELYYQEISSTLGCPEDTTGLIQCLKYEKTIDQIVAAHKKYYVSTWLCQVHKKYYISTVLCSVPRIVCECTVRSPRSTI